MLDTIIKIIAIIIMLLYIPLISALICSLFEDEIHDIITKFKGGK